MKARVYLFHERRCLGWHIITRTGSQQFGVGLRRVNGVLMFCNFLWSFPVDKAPDLGSFLRIVADLADTRVRMEVERIKIKPHLEERFQNIVRQLHEELPK